MSFGLEGSFRKVEERREETEIFGRDEKRRKEIPGSFDGISDMFETG